MSARTVARERGTKSRRSVESAGKWLPTSLTRYAEPAVFPARRKQSDGRVFTRSRVFLDRRDNIERFPSDPAGTRARAFIVIKRRPSISYYYYYKIFIRGRALRTRIENLARTREAKFNGCRRRDGGGGGLRGGLLYRCCRVRRSCTRAVVVGTAPCGRRARKNIGRSVAFSYLSSSSS